MEPHNGTRLDNVQAKRNKEQQHANCIDYWCDHFREHGNDIKLVRPTTDPNLHLFVNGKLAGVFVEKNGELGFCQRF